MSLPSYLTKPLRWLRPAIPQGHRLMGTSP